MLPPPFKNFSAAGFGEMSTLNNYLHQSVAFKQKKQLRPFYELVASITAKEVGHVELVAATINCLLDQAPSSDDPEAAAYEGVNDMRFAHHFIQGGPGHTVANSHGAPWNGAMSLTQATSCSTFCTISSSNAVPACTRRVCMK